MSKPRHPRKRIPSSEVINDEDRALFRSAVGPLRPLDSGEPALPSAKRPEPRAEQFERDEAAVLGELLEHEFDPGTVELGDEIHYLKPGQPGSVLRHLRRGHYSIQAELDLHQMTVAVARAAIAAFLDEALQHREFCVRIIHGKGLRSDARGPVVKRMTEQYLKRRSDVLAFASALPAQGGTGAVLVLLGRQ